MTMNLPTSAKRDGPMPGKTTASDAVNSVTIGLSPLQAAEVVVQDVVEPLGFFEVGNMAGLFEDLPADVGDEVLEGLHGGRRRLVVPAGDDQRRDVDLRQEVDHAPVLERADHMELAGAVH